MIFVIEKLIMDHRSRVEEWESARARWIKTHEYYSRHEYDETHPRPGETLKKAAWIVFVVTAGVLVLGGLIVTIVHSNSESTSKPKHAVVYHNGQSCGKFKIDDHVRIQYGDEQGDTGTIIGGCSSNQDYQVRLDRDQKDEYGNNLGGQTISVDSSGNLVVVQK